jgi:hypothetical protein
MGRQNPAYRAARGSGGQARGRLARQFLQRPGAGGGSFHQRGVLPGDVVHAHDRLVDLVDALGLPAAGAGDLADDGVHRRAGLADQVGSIVS